MWKRLGVIVLWVLATLGTASITLAAVSRVGGEVSDRPAIPVAGADLTALQVATTVQVSETAEVVTTATQPTSDTSAGESGASTTEPEDASIVTVTSIASSTTSTSVVSSTTTTGAPAATTTTSAAPQAPVTTVLVGGTVTVQQAGGSVTLISAIPASVGGPWTAEVKNSGPNQVKVEFESESHESNYQAEISNGELVIAVEEHEEGED